MRQTAIGFDSKGAALEGVLTLPAELPPPYPALAVCPPHPALGGDMDSAVVVAICRAADAAGFASLRFNFRGVKGSQGAFGDDGACLDAKAALDVMRRWPGVDGKRLAMAGYSYGAAVALRGVRRYRAARALALVAPPISAIADSRLRRDKRPKLFIAGQHDGVSPSVDMQRALDDVRQPVQFREVAGANHALHGHEREVGDIVARFAADALGVSVL